MSQTYPGRCFCGTVRIEASGAPEEMGFCHCKDCRAYGGAPVAAFTLWKADDVKVTQGEESLGRYVHSGFSERRFCTKCGGHVMVDHPSLGMVDIHASTLQGFQFEPHVHLNYESSVLRMKDGLPKLKDFPAGLNGGTGEAAAE